MTHNNPYNLIPLKPTGRDETGTINTYSPQDMMTIYEQQFLTEVPEDKITEFLPFLKAFYGIDDNTLDVSAIIFEAASDCCIIYNHKLQVGNYEILGELVKEDLVEDEGYTDSEGNEEVPGYTLDCQRTFFINEVELLYQFNLFIQGDGYSTLTRQESVLEEMYWFVNEGFEESLLDDTKDTDGFVSINEQLTRLGIREMDLTTMREIVNYIEDTIIDDDMVEALNKLLDEAE